MSEKIDGRHSNAGRPEKPINWEKVDYLLMAGCKGTEIAPHFDMHVNTFYDKVLERYKINFTEYSALKRCQGDSLLKEKQFEKALKGDNTLLIWLGKIRLEQKENDMLNIPKDISDKFDQVMAQIKSSQLSSSKESIINNAEAKSECVTGE